MPKISEFFGILISMFFKEHSPPHFHAEYAGKEAMFSIDPIGLIKGQLPPRVRSMVIEWAAIHQNELREDWELARKRETLKKIPPLE